MAPLSNPRWERFALFMAEGDGVKKAYKRAGYKHEAGNAFQLAKKPAIALRVRELKESNRERHEVTVDTLVAELDSMVALSARTGQAGAGVAAILGKAKLLGLIVDRAEIEGVMRRPLREPGEQKTMSFEEWQQKFAPKPPEPA